MPGRPDIQIHANINTRGRDAALRVTMTTYDADGLPGEPRTWRAHAETVWLDGEAETAAYLVAMLVQMISKQEEWRTAMIHLDAPIPGM